MPDEPDFLPDPLRCPITGSRLLRIERDAKPFAQAEDNGPAYPIVDGVPQLLPSVAIDDAQPQA